MEFGRRKFVLLCCRGLAKRIWPPRAKTHMAICRPPPRRIARARWSPRPRNASGWLVRPQETDAEQEGSECHTRRLPRPPAEHRSQRTASNEGSVSAFQEFETPTHDRRI